MKKTRKYSHPTIRQGMKIIVQNVNVETKYPMFDLRCGKCKNWETLCDNNTPYEECPVKKRLNEELNKHIVGWDIKRSQDPLPMPAYYIIYVKKSYLRFCRELCKEYSK